MLLLPCIPAAVHAKRFAARNVANVVWAFAKLGHHPGALMDVLCSRAGEIMEEFIMQNLANFMWALATLGEARAYMTIPFPRTLIHFWLR